MKKATHIISYSKANSLSEGQQQVYGKTDLFNTLRDMMLWGYTDFKITTINK